MQASIGAGCGVALSAQGYRHLYRRRLARAIVLCCQTLVLASVLVAMRSSVASDGNRLSYLDSNEVWFPHKDFPKLVTPQWVGEDGVDCVVTLAIDDMRDPAKYEAYLRPILQRLKQIDGRAPVSIMTCNVKPDDPQLQEWLKEGLSLECHTADHPCPLLNGGDIRKSKATYDKCVDLMSLIPNSRPVAFRTPCCDSLNTVSPRLFSELINRTTSNGQFLQLDSSVFTVYTADDPAISAKLLFDSDGREKFRKYIPRKLKRGEQVHDGFVNTIENYPYPYVIQGMCWEFPCMVPSDWSANHLQQPNNPETVRDLKIALDITVQKQGVFNLVFHPHGWIKAEQVIELIDHAVANHGKRVKFLTFKEAVERLNQNLLDGHSLRSPTGGDNGIRLVDLNDDGFMDCARAGAPARCWNPETQRWQTMPPFTLPNPLEGTLHPVWGILRPSVDALPNVNGSLPNSTSSKVAPARRIRPVSMFDFNQLSTTPLDFVGQSVGLSAQGCHWERPSTSADERFVKVMLRDIDGDGICELLGSTLFMGQLTTHVWLDPATWGHNWRIANWQIPAGVAFVYENGNDAGLRLVDLNEDGKLDLVFSNRERCGAWLFEAGKGWTIELLNLKHGDGPAESELPPIALADGSDNGFFVKDRQLCWINEGTDGLVDFVMRVAFDKLLGDRLSEAKTPDAARQSMRTSAGFRVDLVAHEPLTMDPVAMDWGPDGKMWIAEMADYPRGVDGQGKPGGRVRFLEDLNGDGVYDRSTLFLDDVPFPNGVLAWKRGVLVSAAPDVFYAEDLDGDGKADRKTVLYTGFAEGNQQHRANGFSRGLDNWIYLANGDSGGAVRAIAALNPASRSADGDEKKSVDIRGRDIRIRPDTGEIEAVSGQSQFGRNRDDWGNWFGNNNSRPMWHYLLDDHYLRRNSFLVAPALQKDVSILPGAAPVFPSSRTVTRFNDFHTANRFTSACSSMVYRDNLFHDLVDGKAQVFVSEPVHNLVHREVLTPEGLSFTSQRAANETESEVLSSTDNWFRPTQLKTGPDGALYIADMYRLVIEHPQWIPIEWQRKLDLRAGHDKGRIWRLAPVNLAPRALPRLDRSSVAELVQSLSQSNGWKRDLAQQLLIDRADPTSVPLLGRAVKPLAASSSGAPSTEEARVAALGRLHALCALEGLASLESLRGSAGEMIREILPAAFGDSHPGVRRHAIRISEAFPGTSEEFWRALIERVDDPDPQVRLQLAYSLGEFTDPRAATALGRLAVAGAGTTKAGEIDPVFMAAVISSLKGDNLEPVLAEVMRTGVTQTELLQQLLSQATAFNSEKSLVSLLNRATQPTATGSFDRWQYAAIDQFLVSLERRFTTLDKWLAGLSPAGQPVANRLQVLFSAARKVAADEDAAVEDRVAVLRVLGQSANGGDDIDLLVSLIAPQTAPQLQSAAMGVLARVNSPKVASLLIANYRSLPPGLRAQANEILLSRDNWRETLLGALESAMISPADIDAATRQRLLDHKSKPVSDRAVRIFAMNLNSDRAKLVAEYLPAVRSGGDVQLGSQLFKKVCSQCHKLGTVGHAVGPDLVSLTDKSADALVAAILDPNRAVESKFLAFTAVTKAGLAHTGLLSAETSGSVTLRAAEGKETTLLRSEIEELQSNSKSLMPEGLERDLGPTGIAALVAYIRLNVPLPAMKTFPGHEARVASADAQGNFLLTPFDAEIYGSTVVIEEKHRNLGWWSSADDVVVWTIDVPKPGKYSLTWTYACDATAAGNRLLVEAAGKALTHRVDRTGGWDDYQVQPIGELELPAGQVRITLKPAARPLPALADVKSLVLSPKK